MKIKKIFISISILLCLTFTGCLDGIVDMTYSGENPEIFAIAINSILGDNGWMSSTDEIIEEDEYGRTMARYESILEGDYNRSFYSLIICQKVENGYAYFYPDFNFIIKPEGTTFYQSEIDLLKERNDWGKPLDEGKMIKAKIVERKENVQNKKTGGQKTIFDEGEIFGGLIREDEYFRLLGFGKDKNERPLFTIAVYTPNGNDTSKYSRTYVLILNPDNSVQESYLMRIEDDYNYQEQLKEFKELNDWELYAE